MAETVNAMIPPLVPTEDPPLGSDDVQQPPAEAVPPSSYIATFSRAHKGDSGGAAWWWSWSPSSTSANEAPPAVMHIVPAPQPHLLYMKPVGSGTGAAGSSTQQAAATAANVSGRSAKSPNKAATAVARRISPSHNLAVRDGGRVVELPQRERPFEPPLDDVPPFRFAYVEDGVYRGAYPTLRNFPFLEGLGLRTVISLTPEEPTYDLQCFCGSHNIDLKHIQAERFKGEAQLLPTDLSEALQLLINADCHPVYIHCLDGRHVVGLVVMALRRLQQWRVEASHLEYLRFTKDAQDEVAFIMDYSGPLAVPHCVPPWLWGGSWSTHSGDPKARLGAGIRLKFQSTKTVPALAARKHYPHHHHHHHPPVSMDDSSVVGGWNNKVAKKALLTTATATTPASAAPAVGGPLSLDLPAAVSEGSGVYLDVSRIAPVSVAGGLTPPLGMSSIVQRTPSHPPNPPLGDLPSVGLPSSSGFSVEGTVRAATPNCAMTGGGEGVTPEPMYPLHDLGATPFLSRTNSDIADLLMIGNANNNANANHNTNNSNHLHHSHSTAAADSPHHQQPLPSYLFPPSAPEESCWSSSVNLSELARALPSSVGGMGGGPLGVSSDANPNDSTATGPHAPKRRKRRSSI